MEVQCLEMWGKVNSEKLQNDASLASHFLRVDERVSPMSLWLLSCLLTWILINMDSHKHVHKQTNNYPTDNQTNMTCMGMSHEDSNHLISKNVHHIKHNKDINKWSGRGLIWWIFKLIVTGIFDFINVYWFQWHDQGSSGLSIGWTTQVPAPPPGTASPCCWWADQLRTNVIFPHKRTCSLLTLHERRCSFCSFSIETLSRSLNYCPLCDDIIITSRVSFYREFNDGIKHASIITKKKEK